VWSFVLSVFDPSFLFCSVAKNFSEALEGVIESLSLAAFLSVSSCFFFLCLTVKLVALVKQYILLSI
jgi:hypothetical protein